MTFHSYNEFHLGDNLVHLHWLRAMAQKYPQHEFRHWVHECYRLQLAPLGHARQNLALCVLEHGRPPAEARNVWKNANDYWASHEHRNNFVSFYLEWFAVLATEMGLQSAFTCGAHLLFDYPYLLRPWYDAAKCASEPAPFDFLVINSQPCSGQFRAFNDHYYLDPLIEQLARRWRVVVTAPTHVPEVKCTRDWDLSLSQIGNLSLRIPYHVMIATGPMWPTLNIWSTLSAKLRLVLIDCPEDLTGLAPNLEQERTREHAAANLMKKGLL
jgi:hypothetical protein